MRNYTYILIGLFLLSTGINFAGNDLNQFKKKPLARVNKSGPYIGIQRGKYTNLELGYEFQRKAVKLVKPITHAFNTGLDYNLTQNILGYSVGYWQKRGRLNLTYGASLVYKTNFELNRFGISPTLGYKVSFAHLQFGVNILSHSNDFNNINTFYASLRFVMINNRNYKWRKRKKKD